MTKISTENELLENRDEHVDSDNRFVNRSDALRKTLDTLGGLDARYGRPDPGPDAVGRGHDAADNRDGDPTETTDTEGTDDAR